jgi:tripartite ATP-independent transporter DctP family solute receptor
MTGILLAGCSNGGTSTSESSAAASESAATEGAASSTVSSDDVIIAKLSHSLTETSSYQAGAEYFKQLVEEGTEGRVQIEIYPNNQLGAERDSFEGLTIGTIDIAFGTSSVMAQTFSISTDVFGLPFLCQNSDELYALLDSDVAEEIFSATQSVGVEVLTCYDTGFRQLSNNVRPVNTLEDVKGLKIRCPQSEVYTETLSLLGASPTALAWSELFSALQTGVVDGQETGVTITETNGLGEVLKYYAYTNYMDDPIVFAVSDAFMNKLSAEDQQVVREAAYQSAVYERQWLADNEAECAKILADEWGIEFTTPTDLDEWKAAVSSIYEEYADQDTLKKVQDFLASYSG